LKNNRTADWVVNPAEFLAARADAIKIMRAQLEALESTQIEVK